MNKYARLLIFLVAAIAALGLIIAIVRPAGGPEISDDELSRLAARAHLEWADYGEGIKGALGATPAALWRDGAPIEARLTERGVEVTFRVGPPWDRFDFGMPILLRDPEGRVATPTKYERVPGGGMYVFRREPPLTPIALPWVELRYPPNEEQRITFDAGGVWRSTLR